MGQILKDNVAWILTFLGILATLTSAAIMELRSDIDILQDRVLVLEIKYAKSFGTQTKVTGQKERTKR